MDHSAATPSQSSKVVGGVAPLTQTRTNGVPYSRRSDVEAQIVETLAAAPPAWSPETLKSETLVYLIRWLWKQNDQETIGRLLDCLGKRIARIARDFTSGLTPSQAEDFAIELAEEINISIFATNPTRQSEYLEIAFRHGLKRRAINKLEKLNERRMHEAVESSLQGADGDEGGIGPVASYPDQGPHPEERVLTQDAIRRALAAVSNPMHREAVILHHLQGWPFTDSDPQTPTLSTHFCKSERQIHNWIAKAFEEMRKALGDAI